MARWWLSFAGEDRHLGACIVEAEALDGAISEAWRLQINPGGNVSGMMVDETMAELLSFSLAEYSDRLLSPEEAKGLAVAIDRELSGFARNRGRA